MIWLWISVLFVSSVAIGWALGRKTASRIWDR